MAARLFIRDSAFGPFPVIELQVTRRTAGIRINDGNDRIESRLERRPHQSKTNTAFNKKLFEENAFSLLTAQANGCPVYGKKVWLPFQPNGPVKESIPIGVGFRQEEVKAVGQDGVGADGQP